MLLSRVALMYYEHGMTHQEIANALGLSRVRVTRLLAEAREKGLVEIVIHVQESLFADEERDLVARFHLRQAWIAPNMPDLAKQDKAFAVVGSDALTSVIEKDATVAVGISTAVALAASEFPVQHLGASFIPVAGSGSGPVNGANPHEIALTLATKAAGRAFHLPAPLFTANSAAAQSFYADEGVVKMLSLAERAELLIVGVGGTGRNEGLFLSALTDQQRRDLVDSGAIGDISGRFFNSAGEAVQGALDERIVGLSLGRLKAIPGRLGMVRGHSRLEALSVALRTGLLNMLVTDIDTATALLDRPEL